MIPTDIAVAEVDNHLGGTRYKMGIDPSVMGHIMGMLTRLYKDEELACIREYSTNAWDSHIDAGKTDRPIVVTTPSQLSPYLSIRDEGVGMNEEDIERVYSQYGVSTKRTQKETNGTLGVGGKSALAYGSNFNVIGIKNGVKTFVSVSRDADGSGSMEVVDVVDTDEPNGVEIIIPARAFNSLTSKAQDFFSFWAPGTVILNGQEPSKIDTWEQLSDNLYVIDDAPSDYIVMGNVAYPVDAVHGLDSERRLSYRKHIVAFVEMNGPEHVLFTPSREGLIYDPITLKAISSIRKRVNTALNEKIDKEMAKATTPQEAFAAAEAIRTYFRVLPKMIWHDKQVPASSTYVNDDKGLPIKGLHFDMFAHRGSVTSNVAATYGNLVVYGYPYMASNSVSAHNKRKVRKFFADNEDTYGRVRKVVFVEDPQPFYDNIWFEDKSLIYWKKIAEVSLPKPPSSASGSGGGRKMDGNYDVYLYGGYWSLQDISEKETIFYVDTESCKRYLDRLPLLASWYPDAVIVKVGLNRLNKFRRDFPHAVPVSDNVFVSKFEELVKALSDIEKDYVTTRVKGHRTFNYELVKRVHDKVRDPRFSRMVEIEETGGTTQAKLLVASYSNHYECRGPVDKMINSNTKNKTLDFSWESDYPLVGRYLSYSYDADTILYINAKYDLLNNKETK